ncbi:hypothetical protein DL96DRAFT_1492919 [Flagelloscypha sp. PMI_526]|nr:hypothetical protein DL96DRAFT_1492919 [Flagelloscypha sp. PMI_526]
MSTSTPIPSPDGKTLSPIKAQSPRERSVSRPASRNSQRASVRAPSPSPQSFSLEDPVAVRNQVSTLKHTIRHQQAQLHNLENKLLVGPRPYNPNEDDFISEGRPSHSSRRNLSPTRIPVSSVSNARALADEGRGVGSSKLSPIDVEASFAGNSTGPPSPGRRASLNPGGTTKVLADLQAGVLNARTALDNAKAQLRTSQRTVAQLTRQTEDLKEGRDRLRLENEGLNNVVARKERLLQEVLERARKAESESASLKSQFKSETTSSKKTIRELEATVAEATAISQRSEREYATLRDSLKSLTDSFRDDLELVREEMRRREETLRQEAESMGKKYRELVEHVRGPEPDRNPILKIRDESEKLSRELEQAWMTEIRDLKAELAQKSAEGEKANETAKKLATELARLRRLMQQAGRAQEKEG